MFSLNIEYLKIKQARVKVTFNNYKVKGRNNMCHAESMAYKLNSDLIQASSEIEKLSCVALARIILLTGKESY